MHTATEIRESTIRQSIERVTDATLDGIIHRAREEARKEDYSGPLALRAICVNVILTTDCNHFRVALSTKYRQ